MYWGFCSLALSHWYGLTTLIHRFHSNQINTFPIHMQTEYMDIVLFLDTLHFFKLKMNFNISRCLMTCAPFCYYAHDQIWVPILGPINPAEFFASFAIQINVSTANVISIHILNYHCMWHARIVICMAINLIWLDCIVKTWFQYKKSPPGLDSIWPGSHFTNSSLAHNWHSVKIL